MDRRSLPVLLAGALLLTILGLFASKRSFLPMPTVEGRPIRVVFLGDSLTAGYGLKKEQAYPALVATHLLEAGHQVEVVNLGISGDTTRGGVARLDKVLEARPDLVLVALGANDGARRHPREEVVANLKSIVTRLREEGAGVALAGVRLPGVLTMRYPGNFTSIFPEVADELQLPLLPDLLLGVGFKPELNLPDRVHPNAAGQEILAATVFDFLEPLVESMRR